MNKITSNNNQKSLKNFLKIHKGLTWSAGIFLALYIASLFTPFISNYTKFPLYVLKCGGLPLVADSGDDYIVPGSKLYRVTGLEEAFFCTGQEAQAAGYRKLISPLDN